METLTIDTVAAVSTAPTGALMSGSATAPLRGVYEVVLTARAQPANSFFDELVK